MKGEFYNMDSKIIYKFQNHIISAFNVECNVFNVVLKGFENETSFFCSKCSKKCDYAKIHLYGCYEAVRWDNKYIYYCPCGYIFVAVSVFDEQDALSYSVITGPILMGNTEDFDGDYDKTIPNFSASRVNDISEIISAIFAKKPHKYASADTKCDFLNTIYKELENVKINGEYSIGLEKELQKSIINRDIESARMVLNKLLGQIFFHSNANLKIIKSRVLELIVILSRTAIEGGADIQQIFNLNNNYIEEVEQFTTLEKMSVWLTGIINRFMSYVFEFGDAKHADTIYKITAYIKRNYMKKITLDDIAQHVYLSSTYVSKIFKDEMKVSLSRYINEIRIEKSKVLLLDNSLSLVDVANLVGYEDQSYFTKTFKSIMGLSPGKYREKHTKQ